MHRIIAPLVMVLLAFAASAETLPPVANGNGQSLRDLVGKETLVTVVLKERGATDQNLRVVELGANYISVVAPSGERLSYKFDSVAEVRVQQGKVETRKFNLDENRTLKLDEQKVVDRGFERAKEIFEAANSDQSIKMRAATLLAVNGRADAVEYLRRLSTTNDLATDVDASLKLYLAGDKEIPGGIVPKGLQSGDRKIKAATLRLAGLIGDKSCLPVVYDMVDDRVADISAPAGRALARLGETNAIPALMRMLQELNPEKGDAAIFGLTRLGGAAVIGELKDKLKTTTGQIQYRVVTCLFKLNDPLGKELLTQQLEKFPTLAPEAALLLARDGNWDAAQFLVKRLKNRYDEKEDVMAYRARAAAALVAKVDPTAISYMQDLLRNGTGPTKKLVCTLLAELGKMRLIPVLQPALESSDPDVALQAAISIVAIAKPEFRDRFLEYQQ